MSRRLYQFGSTYLPQAWIADTSQPRVFVGSLDPSVVVGVVLAVSDVWLQPATPAAPVGYTRPSGLGYVRYEDLYHSGDTLTDAMARLTSLSPNALSDGTGYITFPEGVFQFSDFVTGGTYGIYVPKYCKGIWGSGRGTLGGTTGTIFTMKPNSWTTSSPLQATGSGNPYQMMYRGTGTASSVPIEFGQFQVAGTNQGDVDGKCYNGFTFKNPESPVTVQDVFVNGWYGDSGAPPGETFGFGLSGSNGPHKFYRIEADGRRAIGGPAYGSVGLTVEDAWGAEWHDCYTHHGRNAPWVAYQAFNTKTFNMVAGPQDWSRNTGSGQGVNHERTNGTVHTNLTIIQTQTGAGVNMTHSNDTYTTTIDGHACTTVNGTLTVNGVSYTGIWPDGLFYIQSWTPYSNGDTMSNSNPPLVTTSNGFTHIPYKWVHGTSMVIS